MRVTRARSRCGTFGGLGGRASLATLALALGVAGCGGQRWDYEKRGVTAVRLGHDLRECRKEAFNPNTLAIFRRVDQDALNRCMERLGYTVRPAS
jgi:hypothetical protein